jgi:hypothetical protein
MRYLILSIALTFLPIDIFEVPAMALPLMERQTRVRDASFLQSMVGSSGYPGFAYLHDSV